MFGGSGGWLALTCTHGVVYALKALIKHESPADYVDLLLSLKHKPAVLVCDMPDKIAKTLKKRAPHLINDQLGMLAEPTTENIEKVKTNSFHITIPNLYGSQAKKITHLQQLIDKMLILFLKHRKYWCFMMNFIK